MPNDSISTRFQPGAAWCGNAKGRPPGHAGEALSAYGRELGGPDAKLQIEKLHALAVGEYRETKVRLRAIEVLLDRGWGQAVEQPPVVGPAEASQRAEAVSPDPLRPGD